MQDPPVYIIDDDADIAAALTRRLRLDGYAAEYFTDPAGLIEAHRLAPAGCVVTDVLMGATHGFELADALRAQDPGVAIIFMTALPSTDAAVDAVRHHGGIDYLEKPINEDRLERSIREAMSWSIARRRVLSRLAGLSRRERDVFNLLVRGMSNKAIAHHLQINARTVEDHRARIATKTGAHNLEQMIGLTITDQLLGLVSGQSTDPGKIPDIAPPDAS